MADEKKTASEGKKAQLTNNRAALHYSGDVRLLPGETVEISAEHADFVEQNEKHLLDRGDLVLKK